MQISFLYGVKTCFPHSARHIRSPLCFSKKTHSARNYAFLFIIITQKALFSKKKKQTPASALFYIKITQFCALLFHLNMISISKIRICSTCRNNSGRRLLAKESHLIPCITLSAWFLPHRVRFIQCTLKIICHCSFTLVTVTSACDRSATMLADYTIQ